MGPWNRLARTSMHIFGLHSFDLNKARFFKSLLIDLQRKAEDIRIILHLCTGKQEGVTARHSESQAQREELVI